MSKKIILLIILTFFCVSNLSAGNGLFFEAGFGSRLMDGTIEYDANSGYQSDFDLSRDPLIAYSSNSSITDRDALGWGNKFLMQFNGSIGFRISDKYVTSITVQYIKKKGGVSSLGMIAYPNINTQVGEDIQRLQNTNDNNWFSQINLRATQNVYLSNSVFLIAGVELSYLELKFNYSRYANNYKDDTYGLLAGAGYEHGLSPKMSMIFSGLYSFSSYNGDDLFYPNLDLNIGGLEISYKLRYYLK